MAAERPTPTGPLSPDLTIVESRIDRGPNFWSYEKAIHLVVDLGVLEGYPSDTIPGFADRLVELLPGLKRHQCSRGHAGGFVERLHEGTWMGHVAEHIALAYASTVHAAQGRTVRGGLLRRDPDGAGRPVALAMNTSGYALFLTPMLTSLPFSSENAVSTRMWSSPPGTIFCRTMRSG